MAFTNFQVALPDIHEHTFLIKATRVNWTPIDAQTLVTTLNLSSPLYTNALSNVVCVVNLNTLFVSSERFIGITPFHLFMRHTLGVDNTHPAINFYATLFR